MAEEFQAQAEELQPPVDYNEQLKQDFNLIIDQLQRFPNG
jgi:hypothetical protein